MPDFSQYPLGKDPAKVDSLTLMMERVLLPADELPVIPYYYTFKSNHDIPFGCFGNDHWGCCVRTGIANQTLAFEDDEQNVVLDISTEEVLKKYWNQQGWRCWMKKPVPGGRFDNGLNTLSTLADARKNGWKVKGKTYKIHAYGLVNQCDPQAVKTGCYLLNGLLVGLTLPLTAQDQIGKVWEVVDKPGNQPNSWGGHLVFMMDFPDGIPHVMTWGKSQEMTWDFLARYCDELFAVVDNKNSKASLLNLPELEKYLKAVGK